jgi:hypothetical protein
MTLDHEIKVRILASQPPEILRTGYLTVRFDGSALLRGAFPLRAPGKAGDSAASVRNASPEARSLDITLSGIADATAPLRLALKKISVRSGP